MNLRIVQCLIDGLQWERLETESGTMVCLYTLQRSAVFLAKCSSEVWKSFKIGVSIVLERLSLLQNTNFVCKNSLRY